MLTASGTLIFPNCKFICQVRRSCCASDNSVFFADAALLFPVAYPANHPIRHIRHRHSRLCLPLYKKIPSAGLICARDFCQAFFEKASIKPQKIRGATLRFSFAYAALLFPVAHPANHPIRHIRHIRHRHSRLCLFLYKKSHPQG